MLKELSESLVNTITKMISCSTSTKKFKSLLDKGGVQLRLKSLSLSWTKVGFSSGVS